MKKSSFLILITVAGLVAMSPAFSEDRGYHKGKVHIADPEDHNAKLNQCVRTALERHPGAITEVEVEVEDGKTIIDVNVQGKDGKNWEIECDAVTGEVLEDKEDAD